jgi:chaperonin GroES
MLAFFLGKNVIINILAQFLKILFHKISIKQLKYIIMSVNIKPLSDRVLIEPVAAETKTASGIFIPDTAKEKPQKGTVVAVGAGTKDHTMTVKIGDTVLYGKYAGTELKLEGKDFLIMREDDILAII